jgi:hypothetical protein
LWDSWKLDTASFELSVSLIKKELKDNFFLDSQAIDWIISVWLDVFDSLKKAEDQKVFEKNIVKQEVEADESVNTQLQKLELMLFEKDEIVVSLNNKIKSLSSQLDKKTQELISVEDLLDEKKIKINEYEKKEYVYNAWIGILLTILFVVILVAVTT